MVSFSDLIRDDLREFEAYASARQEAGEGLIFLNANESAWSDQFDLNLRDLNRYPEQQPKRLMDGLARFYKIKPNMILATRGSDEAIDLLIRLFCKAGEDAILICPPTYGMYEISARLQGAKIVKVPLSGDGFEFDMNRIVLSVDKTLKLIFLCSPNNPTGNLIDQDSVIKLCQEVSGRSMVIVDEAYIEFSGERSLSEYIYQQDNLVILRTLSKFFGLASIRMGALLGNEKLLGLLKKIAPPYPLSSLSVNVAIEALKPNNVEQLLSRVGLIRQERLRLFSALKNLQIVDQIWPSDANFILVKFKVPVEEICKKQGIILRSMEKRLGIQHMVRITVGAVEENSKLINLLEQL